MTYNSVTFSQFPSVIQLFWDLDCLFICHPRQSKWVTWYLYVYLPWQFLALSFLYFFRYFCLQWTVFSFYNAKEWKKEYMSTGISYTRVKPHNLSTSLFIIIHIFVCSLFSHIQYSYITSYIHAYLFIYSWHTYTHTYKFKVPIRSVGILHICDYKNCKISYLRGLFCCGFGNFC